MAEPDDGLEELVRRLRAGTLSIRGRLELEHRLYRKVRSLVYAHRDFSYLRQRGLANEQDAEEITLAAFRNALNAVQPGGTYEP